MTINNSLLDIYAMMTPKGLVITGKDTDPSNAQDIEEKIIGLLCDPQGKVVSYSPDSDNTRGIKNEIEEYYKGAQPGQKGSLKYAFHAISNNGRINFEDEDYWKYQEQDTKSKKKSSPVTIEKIIDIINLSDSQNGKKLSAFVTSSPRVTPASSGTDAIQFFLNYMPSIMPSRMVPYLRVEFEMHHPPGLKQAQSNSINTPNMIRFLLGSSDKGGGSTDPSNMPITEADKAMLQQTQGTGGAEGTKDTLYMGPEMFFTPQTLTNMDFLGGGGDFKRLVKPKPFLPFASIEDMVIQYMNAGAGALIHKKGTLKLKIHDKARLSELAPFIKGANGFSDVTVWTMSGWLAPRSLNESEDHYSKFINENMIKTDCWMISNTQFTFDAGGQVSLTLEMVSKAAAAARKATIGNTEYQKLQQDLNKLAVDVQGLTANLPAGDAELQADMRTSQLIDASRSGRMLDLPASEAAGYDNIIQKTIASLKKGGRIGPEDIKTLETSIKEIKKQSVEFTKGIQKNFMTILQEASTKPDPFLADNERSESEKGYFNPSLYNAINKFTDSKVGGSVLAARIYTEASNEMKRRGIIIGTDSKDFNIPRVISFGKLFMAFCAPGLLDNCAELQVVFYGLNDECGPVSGHSIAEFPIDTHRLMNGYVDLVKNLNGPVTIEAFMGLVIENQFSDNRAPGYGMYSAYEPYKPTGKDEIKKKETRAYNSVMADWCAKYGSLKRPIIEMIIESSSAATNDNVYDKIKKTRKEMAAAESNTEGLITRVHIYDKQLSPHGLLSKLMRTEGGWTVGEINSEEIEKFLKKRHPTLTKDKKGKVTSDSAQMVVEVEDAVGTGSLKVVDYPYGKQYKIAESHAAVRNFVKSQAPNIIIGTNGTLVKSVSLASKTDGLIAAANIINGQKGANGNGAGGPEGTGLEDPNGLPLRVVPAQLTMTTLGCPIAQMYQQYFVDLGTGTTLDNLYTTTQVSHTIAPGKFETTWTLVYTDGYGKFQAAPSLAAVEKGEVTQRLGELEEAARPRPVAAKK